MQFFGPTNSMTTVDDGTSLLIEFKGQRRWFDLILISAAAAGSLIAIWAGDLWASLGVAALAGIFFFHFLFPAVSIVRASDQGIEVSNQQQFGPSKLWSGRWSEISGLEYRAGGEDEPSGLYVRRGISSPLCVLDRIGQEETYALIDAIYRRFPLVSMAEDPLGLPSLFDSDKPITLGLSTSQSRD
jgi:hypothetical protein